VLGPQRRLHSAQFVVLGKLAGERLLLLGLEPRPLAIAATGLLLGIVGPRLVLVLIAAAVGVATIVASRAIVYKRVGRMDSNTVA
jgi:hypothetical protein